MDWSTADRIAAVNVLATGKTYYVGLANVASGADAWTQRTDLPLSRKAFTFTEATNTPTILQADKITFDALDTAQLDATHITIWDSAAGGTLRAVKALTAAKPMPAGTIASINAGVLTTTMS